MFRQLNLAREGAGGKNKKIAAALRIRVTL